LPETSERQKREIEYHKGHAAENTAKAASEVCFDVIENPRRRWWNAYWSTYDMLKSYDLKDRRVLVVGCGFGEDAFRIAHMGAEVHAFDISEDIIALTQKRATNFGYKNVSLKTMASEKLDYPDSFFDYIFCLDILHHVDIEQTTKEFVRVIKSGGHLIGDELYTHSWMQAVRESYFIEKLIYPAMTKFIYNGKKPYITEDEHKIDEDEFSIINGAMSRENIQYFNVATGRLFPDKHSILSRIDRTFMKGILSFGKYFAGRVIFSGTVIK